MCTLTYIPKHTGLDQITSNRDENPERKTAPKPDFHEYNNELLLFPKDEQSGGSWIACRGKKVNCLLNGAFEQHEHTPPYRRSRGLVLLDSLFNDNLELFKEQYDFTGIEPFTLISFPDQESEIEELRYDGKQVYLNTFTPEKPKIWSSAQLYKPEAVKKREELFNELIDKDPAPDNETIMSFHQFGGYGDPWNDFIMNRENRVRTVSITSIIRSNTGQHQINYYDLLSEKKFNKAFSS